MDFQYFIIAETVAQDSRGVISLIGLDQNIVVAPSLPMRTKRAFIVGLRDNGQPVEGSVLELEMRATAPGGEQVSSTTQELQLGDRPYADLPGTLTLPTEAHIDLMEYGRYTVEAIVKVGDNEPISRAVELYVVRPEESDSPHSASEAA